MLPFPTGSLHAYLLLLRELKLFSAPFHESLSYLKHTNPHLYYRFLSCFQNTTSLSDLRMPLEKPFSVFVHLPRDIPNLAWSFPKRTPSHLYADGEKKDVESKGENIEKMKEGETRPMTIAMLFEPPPPPIKTDSLPTISVTLMRSRRICDLPWYDKEVMGSEAQYIPCNEEATSETICERRGGIRVEEKEEEEEEEEGSRRRDLRGTFEIKRLSDEKLEYGMEPEKTCLRESTLPHFTLNFSCESEEEEKEEELTTNSPHPSTVDTEGMSLRSVSNSLRICYWLKGLFGISCDLVSYFSSTSCRLHHITVKHTSSMVQGFAESSSAYFPVLQCNRRRLDSPILYFIDFSDYPTNTYLQ
ncbi:unnamed protein product [Rodentolepis nana]|uniref:Uncharacterized protein n=1 Tax=Rodentolepis nana TaxID=102285 RepID=A0A0R3TQW8_RODNA|nr:unnamed protein product [Rodentolepis nana]